MSPALTSPPLPAPAYRRDLLVPRAWVDYNGHMGDYAYGIAFSETVTAFMGEIGLDDAYRDTTKATLYTLDLRIGYRKECHEGDRIELALHVLETDAKRIHLYLAMTDQAGALLAWNTQVLMHVSQAGATPKSAAFPAETRDKLAAFARQAAGLRALVPEIDRPLGLSR